MNDTPKDKAKRHGVPVIPRRAESTKQAPRDPNPVVAVCGECGLEIRQTMGYYCPKANCPTGLGGQ
jgi:hypothetical protein